MKFILYSKWIGLCFALCLSATSVHAQQADEEVSTALKAHLTDLQATQLQQLKDNDKVRRRAFENTLSAEQKRKFQDLEKLTKELKEAREAFQATFTEKQQALIKQHAEEKKKERKKFWSSLTPKQKEKMGKVAKRKNKHKKVNSKF